VQEIGTNARLLPYVEPAAIAAVDGTRTTVRRFECRRGRRIPEVTLDQQEHQLAYSCRFTRRQERPVHVVSVEDVVTEVALSAL
jgi:hypothetical protein